MKNNYGSIVLIVVGMLNLLIGYLANIETWAFVLMLVFWGYIFIVTIYKLVNSKKA